MSSLTDYKQSSFFGFLLKPSLYLYKVTSCILLLKFEIKVAFVPLWNLDNSFECALHYLVLLRIKQTLFQYNSVYFNNQSKTNIIRVKSRGKYEETKLDKYGGYEYYPGNFWFSVIHRVFSKIIKPKYDSHRLNCQK